MTVKSSDTKLSRREALRRGAALAALASAQLAMPSWMPRMAFAKSSLRGDILVVIFLRGGADGMNLIVPFGDNAYYTARPRLGLKRPDENVHREEKAVDLDGFFGLNPQAATLKEIFTGKQMLAVHACGSPDATRSHFDAMSYMERGTPVNQAMGTGWIGRHLNSFDSGNRSPMRAIGWGNTLQESLHGSINAMSLQSIVDYHLPGNDQTATAMLEALNALYGTAPDSLKLAAEQTIAVTKLNIAAYKPANGAQYNTQNDFDMALMQTAALIKADIGLEIAAIDVGGWDTHQNQTFFFNPLVYNLAYALKAFHTDMQEYMDRMTVVVMSEFGRRLQENASVGTDHGHGGVMMLMGDHVAEKPVIADWPGLRPENLDHGDLKITTDYRDILSEILIKRLNNTNIEAVFPDFKPTERGVIRPK